MEVASTVAELRALRRAMSGDTGFVPTLGYLHEGHLSLLRAARSQNAHAVASIFVNPTQFNDPSDFDAYPRDTERDLTLLREEGVDVVFMPSVEEMYPEGAATTVEVAGLTERLEGAARPGHFAGVTTVVANLFNIVQPARAYFGRKDAQQLVVIRRMVEDLQMDVEIVDLPTVREPDGLAMSSRNAMLSPEEREAATVLSKSLRLAKQRYATGERDAEAIRNVMVTLLGEEPLARVDYVSVADTKTLEEIDRMDSEALVSLAVRIGDVRLIDNVTLPAREDDTL